MHHGLGAMRLDGFEQAGQVPHVLSHGRIASLAKLETQEIRTRLGIDEHHLLAARERILGEGGADQAGASDERGHRCCYLWNVDP
jgi:hypothetical protein